MKLRISNRPHATLTKTEAVVKLVQAYADRGEPVNRAQICKDVGGKTKPLNDMLNDLVDLGILKLVDLPPGVEVSRGRPPKLLLPVGTDVEAYYNRLRDKLRWQENEKM